MLPAAAITLPPFSPPFHLRHYYCHAAITLIIFAFRHFIAVAHYFQIPALPLIISMLRHVAFR